MANFFKTAVGLKDKRDESYRGSQPVAGLAGVQGGKEYYDSIYNRVVGRNDLGFGSDYAEKYANPIVKNMRNNFSSYQLPELKSELTSSGRRGGSAGSDLIRRAYQEQGLQEGDVFSKLQQRNEDQSRNELNTAIGQMGDYAGQEADLKNNLANWDYQNYQNQLGREDARQSNNSGIYRNLLAGAVNLGTGIAGSVGGVSGAGYQTPFAQTMPAGYGSNMQNQGYNSFGQWNTGGNKALYKQMLPKAK